MYCVKANKRLLLLLLLLLLFKKKSKATFIQIHSIPYNIHYNPQKHPDSLMEESSMPQNQMEKENLSIF